MLYQLNKNLNSINKFVENNFFRLNLDIDQIRNLQIGDAKGSSIKLLIMIQEIITYMIIGLAITVKQAIKFTC